jgi:hypothetical protein
MKSNLRPPATPLDHPETIKELVAMLDTWPGLQVRYVKADPANGPAASFIEIYPASFVKHE